MTERTHARLSPSSAERWTNCPGSVVLEEDLPDTSSEHSDEGSDAHFLASSILDGTFTGPAAKAVGFYISHKAAAFSESDPGGWRKVTADMAENVQSYVDTVRALADSTGGTLLVEQRLSIEHITGEPNAKGTADAVILTEDEIIVVDLKFGMGVKVDASYVEDGVEEPNKQIALYALGALEQFDLGGSFERVRLMIHQPRLSHVSEYAMPAADLLTFGERLKKAASACRLASEFRANWVDSKDPEAWSYLQPSESACQWCKAKPTCPKLALHVAKTVELDWENLSELKPPQAGPTLGQKMAATGLIESWCKAVRAKVEAELLQGNPVEGWKLVQGRKGARAWLNEDDAKTMLATFRLKQDEMYDFKLISPTTAEKLANQNVIGARQWQKIQSLIVQKEGSPSVAPESDKRPAIEVQPTSGMFEVIDDGESLS